METTTYFPFNIVFVQLKLGNFPRASKNKENFKVKFIKSTAQYKTNNIFNYAKLRTVN